MNEPSLNPVPVPLGGVNGTARHVGGLMVERDAITLEPTPGTEGPRLAFLTDLVGDLVREAEEDEFARKNGKPRGPKTNLPEVDRLLGGFLRPGVHFLQAAPGDGKTAFSLQVSADCGFPGVYVTAEMAAQSLFIRLIARTTKTPLGKLIGQSSSAGEILAPEQVGAAAETTAKRVSRLAFLDATRGVVRTEQIISAAEDQMVRFEARRVLVVLDSLQVWSRGLKADGTEYDRVSFAVDALNRIARRLSCPILAISHKNRAGQGFATMSGAKGSGDIEYAAESMIDLAPPLTQEDDNPLPDHLRRLHLAVLKNRWGSLGIVPLTFDGRLQSFREA
jgi:replicative DNA helicase